MLYLFICNILSPKFVCQSAFMTCSKPMTRWLVLYISSLDRLSVKHKLFIDFLNMNAALASMVLVAIIGHRYGSKWLAILMAYCKLD